MTEALTAIDIKILHQIQQDSSLSTTELAEKVGLSQSPCWRRLQRLRDEGYIKGQVAILNRKKFGESFIIFSTLKMGSLSDEERAQFQRKIELTPEILECHTIFGDRDVIVKIIAESLDWYQRFIFKVIMKLPGVQDVVSTVTLSELKQTTAIPVRSRNAV